MPLETQVTDWFDWHPDPVYRVDGRTLGAYNYTPDLSTGAVDLFLSNNAGGFYTEAFGGPHPGADAAACVYSWNTKGQDLGGVGVLWSGVCPDLVVDPANTFGIRRESLGSADYSVTGSAFTADLAGASARIAGWLIRTWRIRLYQNPWMDDDDLEVEYVAAQSAARAALPSAGEGWFLEFDHYYPLFVKFQVAPDEIVSTAGQIRTDPVRWFRGPFTDVEDADTWAFTGLDPSDAAHGVWTHGKHPNGTVLTEYSGGLVDWLDPPDEWQPEQDLSQEFFTEWLNVPVTDEEVAASAIPLTLACESVYSGTFPGNATKGRTEQWLMMRVEYQLPKFRFTKTSPYPLGGPLSDRQHFEPIAPD